MKKVPVSYRAESPARATPKWLVIVVIAIVLLFIGSMILSLNGFGGKSVSRILSILAIGLQSSILSICYIARGQSISINAANNTIIYYSGRKQYRIKPKDIKNVQFTDRSVEIITKNDRMIRINSENFPKVDMQGFANYVKSVMGNEDEIKNEFIEREDSGFHVTKKRVMETPNPWPHVFFIGFCFLAVIITIYLIFRLIFA
jgi:hypothetical protein